jgi:hypothetical protein
MGLAVPSKVATAEKAAHGARSARGFTPPALALQQEIGNQAVQSLFKSGALQARLRVGVPTDPLEEEADAMADRVVQRMHVGAMRPMAAPSVQAKCADCLEEERLQRQAEDDAPDELLQAKADCSMEVPGSVAQALEGATGGGKMDSALRDEMESAFEADFSGVRIHTGPSAERLNRNLSAHAFTYGTDIYFNAGEYRPETQDGRHLLAHELTHVVQQSGVSRAALKEEADEPRTIQARQIHGVIQRDVKKREYVPYQIHVSRQVTREEFQALAMRQIFGGVVPNVVWQNAKDLYVPDESPYTVNVDLQLLQKSRGEAGRERGITLESGGGITGAEERAKAFHAAEQTDEKSALMDEINRRYFEAVGDATKTKIKPGEKGKAALWRMIRDEVLFQHEYIRNLPPNVKELIKFSTSGRDLTPADYDRLFAIAKKIEKMPAGQASDYASKVTGSTVDLATFEASLDKYIADAAARDTQTEERDKIQTKLLGLEKIYEKYRLYKDLLKAGTASGVAATVPGAPVGGGIVASLEASKLRQELDTELQAHDFAGVTEFEEYIKKFEAAFEAGAASIAKDLLAKFAGKLYRESERYKDPGKIHDLHQKLGGYRASYAEFETNAPIWYQYDAAQRKAEEQRRIPGQGHLKTSDFTSITPGEAEEARKKFEAAKASAQSQFVGLASNYPIFQEEGLPDNKKLDKAALAKANESQLGAMLQVQIQRRMRDIEDAKAEIEGKSELIYKMDKLMPQFYAQLGIRPGSIHDMIIQDKMRSDLVMKIVMGIAFAILAIALAVVSFGTATPAIVAAGAAIAGATLGAYQAYESYQEYVEEKALADVGLAKDPSIVWLVIAVVGAAIDMAAAAKAVGALGKAAKALEAGGELAEFTETVKALERANEIEAKVARAAEKAAAARKSLAESTKELGKALGKAYGFPGPLTDPEVYKAVLKMARDAIKSKVYDAAKFIEEIKLAKVNAKLGELTPEELAKVKRAWEEAKALEALEKVRYEKLLKQIPDAATLDALIAKAGDAEKLERLLTTFPQAELEPIFGQLKDTTRLATMLEHVGSDTTAGMVRGWMKEGTKGVDKMNQFLERIAAGGKQLGETSSVGAKTIIIDSNAAIALVKDADPALRATLQPGEKAWVAYIKSLPADTELRVGSVTIGEIKGGVINVKGMPISVARESSEYQKVLSALAKEKVGTGAGFADRGVIADAIFAKVEPGVIPKMVTGDKNAVKSLARMAGIDVVKAGGYPGLAAKYGSAGFEVTIEGRKLMVVPLPLP